MRAIGLLWVLGLGLTGCATTALREVVPTFPEGEDGVALISVLPASPARLAPQEHLNLRVAYQVATVENATLYVRPYTGGRQSRNYLGHPPIVCTNGTGVADAWIAFRSDAVVEELRLILLEEGRRKPLAQTTNLIEAVWGDAP